MGHKSVVRAATRAVPATTVIGPTIVAAALVLYELTSRSLWVDEGATYTTVTQTGSSLWHWMLYDGGNMVAYYGFEHVVVTVFGTGMLALRLPSAIAMIATVPLAGELVRRLIDRRTSFIVALFVAVSLPLVYWGQMARGYAPGICLLMAAMLTFVVAVQGGGRWWWVCFVAASVLAVYTLVLSALVIVALFVSVALLPPSAVPRRQLIVSGIVSAALCAPLTLAAEATGAHAIDWQPPITTVANSYVAQFVTGSQVVTVTPSSTAVILTVLTIAAWIGVAAVVVFMLVRHGRSVEGWGPGFLLVIFAVPAAGVYLASVLVHPILQERYFLMDVPTGSILVGYLVSLIRPPWLLVLCAVSALVLRALQLVPAYGVDVESWRSAAAFTLAEVAPRDCIAFYENDGYQQFDYYVAHPTTSEPTKPPRLVLPATSWSSHEFVAEPTTLSGPSLTGVDDSCSTLWLVTTHLSGPPSPGATAYSVQNYDQFVALSAALGRAYATTTSEQFKGVGVFRYSERRVVSRVSRR